MYMLDSCWWCMQQGLSGANIWGVNISYLHSWLLATIDIWVYLVGISVQLHHLSISQFPVLAIHFGPGCLAVI